MQTNYYEEGQRLKRILNISQIVIEQLKTFSVSEPRRFLDLTISLYSTTGITVCGLAILVAENVNLETKQDVMNSFILGIES